MLTEETAHSGAQSSTTIDPLIRDFLEWLAAGERPYAEVMESWRTSCPRLTVWEDAVDLGLVAREGGFVRLTAAGKNRIHA